MTSLDDYVQITGTEVPGRDPEQAAELLRTVRDDAMGFLSAVPYPPRALRVRVGEVSLEVEWQQPVRVADDGGAPAPVAVAAAAAVVPAQATQPAAAAPAEPVGHAVKAPSVGVFYRSPSPGEPSFVEVGDTVRAGQQIGIVEVMKLMIPVEADRAGTVREVLKENGASVEYDEPLIRLAPDAG